MVTLPWSAGQSPYVGAYTLGMTLGARRLPPTCKLGVALLLAISAGACAAGEEPCEPTAERVDCVSISGPALRRLALERSDELGVGPIGGTRVLVGEDATSGERRWIVLMFSQAGASIVAAARFEDVDTGQARFVEVVAPEVALPRPPENMGGEFVMWDSPGCRGDPSMACLFDGQEWAIQLGDGRYRLFDGQVVEAVPSPRPV